jgi:hypothetical protein
LAVTSALLFVALLAVVDLSYRRWVRRSRVRRRVARRVRIDREIVLDAPDASVLRMRARRETQPDQHRST